MAAVTMYTGYPNYVAFRPDQTKFTPEAVPASGAPSNDKTQQVQETQPVECQTCKERKYMDRSDENNVSFQTPTHIDPSSSGAQVMAHERMHVQNAFHEGQADNKKLISVSVSLKTGVCPECGRTYIAGGVTRTRMLTYRPNPYDQNRKSVEGTVLRGMNVNRGV